MNTSPINTNATGKPKRRKLWKLAGATSLVLALAAIGVGAHNVAQAHGSRGGWHGASQDPAAMERRTQAMVDWMLADVNATADQKQKIGAIAKQAFAEVAPLRTQGRETRQKVMELLAAPNVDRAAVEQLRAQGVKAMETASQRMTRAMLDAAEVLTPEQRTQLAAKMKNRRGGRGGPGMGRMGGLGGEGFESGPGQGHNHGRGSQRG